MICQICYTPYDHSRHRPFSLTCPHTFCLSCVDKLKQKSTRQQCPTCNAPITHQFPNLALLETIPESNYDLLKSASLKLIVKSSELNKSLNVLTESKLEEGLQKIRSIKQTIKRETNNLICLLKENENILIEEADLLESQLSKCMSRYTLDEEIIKILKSDQISIAFNELKENQLADKHERAKLTNAMLASLIDEVEKLNEHFEFSMKTHVFIDDGQIGQIITSQKLTDSSVSEGKRLMSSREYNEAIKCFDEAIRFKPNDSVAYHLKGLCLQFLQDYAEAIRCFDNALKLNPNCASFYDSKGICLLELKRYQAAIDAFQKAFDLEPANKVYQNNKDTAINLLLSK